MRRVPGASELRRDPLTGRWVVVSPGRAGRIAAVRAAAAPDPPDGRPCPFCPGNEAQTRPALATHGPGPAWRVRVVPNLYPIFEGDAVEPGPGDDRAPAGGHHEVVVLTPGHGGSWADLDDDQLALVAAALGARLAAHAADPGVRYSQLLVNHGRDAGASLAHPHAQVLAMGFVPPEVATERAAFAGACPLCAAVDRAAAGGAEVVAEGDDAVVLCPSWGGSPYEMLVVPRRHHPHLHTAGEGVVLAVAAAARDALRRLEACAGPVPHNLVFHAAPFGDEPAFHWHVHVVPRLTVPAGFEAGTGVMVNVVAPEVAAAELRAAPPPPRLE